MRKKKKEPKLNLNRWMVTYADFVTLMFAFFAVLYATSTSPSGGSVETLGGSVMLNEGMFRGSYAPGGVVVAGSSSEPAPRKPDFLRDLGLPVRTLDESELEKKGKKSKESLGSSRAIIYTDERGTLVSLSDTLIFSSGSAEIRPEALPFIKKIAIALLIIPNKIIIEGHTDDLPIQTHEFTSNWELSAMRASNIARYFIEKQQWDPFRLTAVGYGQFHPITTNKTGEGRAKNRRVNILVVGGNLETVKELFFSDFGV